MVILGLSAYAHEASACVLRDGIPVALVEEERVNRQKHTWCFPEGAIIEVLRIAGASVEDIDIVTFFFRPWNELKGNLRHFVLNLPRSARLLSQRNGRDDLPFFERFRSMTGLRRHLRETFPGIRPSVTVQYIEHHLAHAASCFHISPFDRAAILTVDGRGEDVTALAAVGEGNRIEKRREWLVPHSLGHLYAAVTDFLGFKPFFDEWKVMGLSAYGTERRCGAFKEIVACTSDGGFSVDLDYFRFQTDGRDNWTSRKFQDSFGAPRLPHEDLDQRHCDIACALQRRIEEVGVHMATHLRAQTRLNSLVMAGGVVLNCLMNRKIVEDSGFKNFFFQPVANDAGTSMGSALYYHHAVLDRPRTFTFQSSYLGPEYTDVEIEAVLKASSVRYERSPNIAARCAALIAEGMVVGWFQGRMECGPRALGNRSIVADPRRADMKDILNARVKKREWFRPFAPAVLAEKAGAYFRLPADSPYMILVGDVLDEMKDRIPAVTHKDGTARVQTVHRSTNPLFWELISEFEAITGIGVVLNTSFNENEPIVMTPSHAIDCFLRTEFDALGIGNFLVRKTAGNPAGPSA